jgi:Nucleotidyltransferase domain
MIYEASRSQDDAMKAIRSFLQSRSLAEADLLAQVTEGYGEPELVAATGSIAAGVGNRASDIDLVVVVPSQKVTSFPVTSFIGGLMVDTDYVSTETVRSLCTSVRSGLVGNFVSNCDTWSIASAHLRRLARLSESAVLVASSSWQDQLDELRSGILSRAASQYWEVEAYRRWIAASWMSDITAHVACLRFYEALIAAAESLMCAEGRVYTGLKWVPAKAARSESLLARDLVEAAQAGPICWADDPHRFMRKAHQLLQSWSNSNSQCEYRVNLLVHSSATVEKIGGKVLVHRDNLAGVALNGEVDLLNSANRLVWSSELFQTPEPWLLALFAQNVLWLDVSYAENGHLESGSCQS